MNTIKSSARWWDFLAAIFLVVALITSATRLYATNWTVYLERVQYLTLLAAILGLALGQSSFSTGRVRLFALVYTLFFIPWQLMITIGGSLSWGTRLGILAYRVGVAAYEFGNSQPVHDPILFLTLMALLYWLIGLISGYYLTRHGSAWPAVIPAGLAMVVINHYDPGLASWARYMGVYLFLSLLLVGRMTYLHYKAEWQAAGIFESPETRVDISKAAVTAVIVLVLLSWTVPALGASLPSASRLWVQVSKPWDKLRGHFSDAFSSLQSSIGVVTDFYGSTLALGTGTRLGDDIVFTVDASGAPPPGGRFYWKARSYDHYDIQKGWDTTITTKVNFTPDNPDLKFPSLAGREQMRFTFTSQVSLLNTLYLPDMALWVSHPGQASVTTGSDGTDDVTMITADPPLHSGDVYRAQGWISNPTISDLQASRVDYPAWVKQLYLQVPSDASPQVRALAQRITVGLNNPYDKADAITRYLRRTITYSTTVQPAPAGVDPLDWFLFTTKVGYCNYYASAEVIMLRMVGVPARMAVGFAQGDKMGNGSVYTVRYKDSHAWPEVYFNDYGWIEFEPTVSQPSRDLPLGSTVLGDLPNNQDPAIIGAGRGIEDSFPGAPERPKNDPVLTVVESSSGREYTILLLIVVVLLGVVAWLVSRNRYSLPVFPVWLDDTLTRRGYKTPQWVRNWARKSVFSPLERTYGSINLALRLVGHPAPPAFTPNERMAQLRNWLPQAAEPARVVVEEYQHAKYSLKPGNLERAREASGRVRLLAYQAFLRRIFRRSG